MQGLNMVSFDKLCVVVCCCCADLLKNSWRRQQFIVAVCAVTTEVSNGFVKAWQGRGYNPWLEPLQKTLPGEPGANQWVVLVVMGCDESHPCSEGGIQNHVKHYPLFAYTHSYVHTQHSCLNPLLWLPSGMWTCWQQLQVMRKCSTSVPSVQMFLPQAEALGNGWAI